MTKWLQVSYAAEALCDLEDIYTFIARDNPFAAARVIASITDALALASPFPLKSRKTRRAGVRALPLSRYPYIVFFRIEGDELRVLHFRHGARRHPGFSEDAVEFAHA